MNHANRVAGLAALGIALLVALPLAASADGDGGNGNGMQFRHPDYVAATGFLADGRYAEAIPLLRKAIAEDGPDADAYNLIGYSIRKLGRLAEALAFYEQALSIDPEHRGAHEYIGEAYLELGRLGKAMEHLAFLDDDCWLPCEEYSDLKEGVARYESERR